MDLLYTLMLGFAVSLDSFAAGVAYGVKSITIPIRSLAVVGTVTAVCVAVAMVGAHTLGRVIDLHIVVFAGALLLIGLGIVSLFREHLTKDIPAYEVEDGSSPRNIKAHKLVASIIAKPETANLCRSKTICSFEALFLGLALGLDNMAATFAASLTGMLPQYTPLLMGVIQMAFIAGGRWASFHWFSESLKKRFHFFSGALLIIIGLLRLM